MAFKKRYLEKLTNILHDDAGNPTGGFYFYQTADSRATVRAANYFDASGNILYAGDIIIADCGGTIAHLKVVNSPTKGDAHVTTTDMGLGGKTFASGQAVTATASDTIVTGLGTLTSVMVTEDDNPVVTAEWFTGSIGDQVGAPAAGSFLLKTWKPTAVNDATPIAGTTFGKKVNWIAFGLTA